ncbi:MAG: MFS transporter [Elusimicrobia bacterium]|nr:MFS transporter [Elusimicrobiota bacterium]
MFLKNIGRNVVFLGVVSGLTDISSEMLYPIMPLFLTTVLGAPMTVVGLIEGVAEATASLLKAASGLWSDRAGRRKPFVLWGYGLSALSKPLLALAGAWPFVLFCRFLDRTGKGVRTSARDALITASSEPEHWGRAFGFHRAMDTAGAVAGPLATVFLLSVCGLGYRSIFLIAAIPAVLGVLVLAAFVEERRSSPDGTAAPRGGAAGLATLRVASSGFSADYKRFLLVYGLFAVGNSSDVFLLLKAAQGGLSPTKVVLAYVLYNAVYALAATPAGMLADRLGRTRTLAAGLAVFAAVYLGFARVAAGPWFWLLFPVYGCYTALAESSLNAAIAERCTAQNRATAMGLFQGTVGVLALAASLAAGWLWTQVSPAAPFYLGAACAAAAAPLLLLLPERARS